MFLATSGLAGFYDELEERSQEEKKLHKTDNADATG